MYKKKNQKQKSDKTKKRQVALVKCTFCKGRGVDPFAVPSKLSKCQTCKGRKENFILEPYEECPVCAGSGVYKHHRLPCAVCGGRGYLHRIPDKDRKYGCRPENKEMIDIETGLPCISSYDLSPANPRIIR